MVGVFISRDFGNY